MHSAQELHTRWPSLDTAARYARLKNTLEISPGPLAEIIRTHVDAAERAAVGLWRREPSTWSADPVVQQTIGNRLGWLSSPVLMAESLDRLQTFAETVKRDGFSTSCCSAWAARVSRLRFFAACWGFGQAGPSCTCLDSTAIPAALFARFRSRDDGPFGDRLLAARQQFGGHAVKTTTASGRTNGR